MITRLNVPTARPGLLVAALFIMAMLVLSGAPAAVAQDDGAAGPWVVGGAYRLTLTATDARPNAHAYLIPTAPAATAAGGSYVLLLPAEVLGTGTPCCCMHLPCIKK